MNWIIAQGGLPGEQLANNVLNADLVNVLGLIIALLALSVVVVSVCGLLMMYYNSKGISTLAATQQNMTIANAQWAANDSRKTDALARSVDEIMLLRQDHMTSSSNQQRLAEETKKAVDAHEDKTEVRVKTIIEQVTAGNEQLHGALQIAVKDVNEGTRKAIQPALDALDKLVLLGDSFDTRTESTREMLRLQHEQEMKFLQEQHEAHMRVWRDQITQAQHQILDSLKQTEEKLPHEQPIQLEVALTLADPVPVPDDGSATQLGGSSGSN